MVRATLRVYEGAGLLRTFFKEFFIILNRRTNEKNLVNKMFFPWMCVIFHFILFKKKKKNPSFEKEIQIPFLMEKRREVVSHRFSYNIDIENNFKKNPIFMSYISFSLQRYPSHKRNERSHGTHSLERAQRKWRQSTPAHPGRYIDLLSSLSQLVTLPFQSQVCLSKSKANPLGHVICFRPDFVHLYVSDRKQRGRRLIK